MGRIAGNIEAKGNESCDWTKEDRSRSSYQEKKERCGKDEGPRDVIADWPSSLSFTFGRRTFILITSLEERRGRPLFGWASNGE